MSIISKFKNIEITKMNHQIDQHSRQQPSRISAMIMMYSALLALGTPSVQGFTQFSPLMSHSSFAPTFHLPNYSTANTSLEMVSSSTNIRRTYNRNNSRIRKSSTASKPSQGPEGASTEFTKPLTKSTQTKLFKLYSEYSRIKSILGDELMSTETPLHGSQQKHPTMSLEQKAKACGYDSADPKSMSKFTAILLEGPKTRETLFLHNMGLVHFVVNKYAPKLQNAPNSKKTQNNQSLNSSSSSSLIHLSEEDLIQEGSIGLAKAIDKFDPSLNYQFSTYATHWIKSSVTRCIAKRDELIRVPEHVSDAIRKLNRVEWEENTFSSKMEKEKALAKKTGLTENMVREAAVVRDRRRWSRHTGGYVAIEDWMMTTSKKREAGGLADIQSDNEWQEMEREGIIQHLKDTISPFLNMKEMEALSWRYGLLKDEETREETLFRDYESEAERDLFGPQGILSSSPTITSSSSIVSGTTKKIRSLQQTTSPSPATTTVLASSSRKSNSKKTATVKRSSPSTKGGRWGEAMSFNEVGEQMRISGEYGRRLCASALKKLSKAAEEGRLEPSMLF